MDLWQLKKDDVVLLDNGVKARVLALTEDGRWIKVRYLEAPEDPGLIGTEDLCAEDEVVGLADESYKASN